MGHLGNAGRQTENVVLIWYRGVVKSKNLGRQVVMRARATAPSILPKSGWVCAHPPHSLPTPLLVYVHVHCVKTETSELLTLRIRHSLLNISLLSLYRVFRQKVRNLLIFSMTSEAYSRVNETDTYYCDIPTLRYITGHQGVQ